MVKQPKAILSCRISPDLKHEVELTAKSEGLTTSNYVQQLILQQKQGEHISEDRVGEYLQKIQELENRLSEAERIRVEYEGRLDYADSELETLQGQFDQVMDGLDKSADETRKIQRLESLLSAKEETILELKTKESLNLLFAERTDYSEHLEKLQAIYPDATKEQIVVGSLYAAVENEGAFVFTVTQVKNYLKSL